MKKKLLMILMMLFLMVPIYTSANENEIENANVEDTDAQLVYNTFTKVRNAMNTKLLEELDAAVDEFYLVVEVFNELDDAELEELAVLLGAEDGASAWNTVFSEWVDANTIINIADAYSAYKQEPTPEHASTYVECMDSYDDMYEDNRTMIKAFVADVDEVYTEATEKAKEVVYPIWIGNTQITSKNCADIFEDGTASYNPETNILTLNNFKIEEEINYGLNVDGNLEIQLIGENFISNQGMCGMRSTGTLTIGGNGSLKVFGLDYGIYSKKDLTIGDNVKLDVSCGDITDGDNFAICMNDYDGELTISGEASVQASAGTAPVYSYGIYSANNLTICDNAVVDTTAGKGQQRSCGMYAISNIWINDNAQAKTIGLDNSDSSDAFNDSYGIRTTQLYVNGGALTAIGGNSNSYSAGIFTQIMSVDGGYIVSKGSNTTKGPSGGLKVTSAFDISGGTVEAVSGNAPGNTSSAMESGTTHIYGGTIKAASGEAENTWGLLAEELQMEGGKLDVTVGAADNMARGIQAFQALTIHDGEIHVKVNPAKETIYGMQTAGALKVLGGKIHIVCENAVKCQAVWAFESVTIGNGEFDIVSEGDGIYVPYGNVLIGMDDIAVVDALGESEDHTNIRVSINADGNYGIYAGLGLKINENLVLGNAKDLEIAEKKDGETSFWTITNGQGNVVSKDILISPKADETPEETESESKPETDSETESESKPETEPETKPETETESKPETKAETETESKPETKPETKPTGTPGTGDSIPVNILIGMMAGSFILMMALFVFWKRKA